MPIIHGTAIWPGVRSVESCTYTIGHGITPGTAVLKMQPQSVFPAMFGTLVITDGTGTVAIPGCKINSYKVDQDESGTVISLEIVDGRWRWRDLGGMLGCYNQLDPHGKLIPWTIRSPTELALLCLQALGVSRFSLNLPPGLNYPGPFISTPIPNISGVNPPINWNGIPPAQALQQVAELFGCRVIYQLYNDSILVTPVGVGNLLPPGSVHKQGPSIKAPETPDAVGVLGSPTRYQMQLKMIAVGEEWDGSYRPINLLSYAPSLDGQVQIYKVLIEYDTVTVQPGFGYDIYLGAVGNEVPESGTLIQRIAVGGDTADTIAFDLCAAINASNSPKIKNKMKATVVDELITITGNEIGFYFKCLGRLAGASVGGPHWPPGNTCEAAEFQQAKIDRKAWDYSLPPFFAGVRATDRLTIPQARNLAQKSVFKCYQVSNVDVSGKGPIRVPGYGTLLRRQQIVLQDTQVDQIVPQPGDQNVRDVFGMPFTVNLYNGYSKDKPAAVYGVAANSIFLTQNIFYGQASEGNTLPSAQLYMQFSVDPIWQLITFSNYMYKRDGPKVLEAVIRLQTSVLIRDAVTNQIQSYLKVVPLPGQQSYTLPKIGSYPDVQLNVTSTYDENGKITGVGILEIDPVVRANYYLAGLAAQYNLSNGQIIEYNGIKAIQLDGAIQQVTWSVGGQGAVTTASRNTEHEIWVPPYAARRRAEFLPPVAQGRPQRVDMVQPGKPLVP